MRVLFLYTELADYFLKCCEALSKDAEIHIVRWPVNKEAPFKFTFPEGIQVYDKNDFTFSSLKEKVNNIDPDIIICSGWIDKEYLKLAGYFSKSKITVMTCDTQWNGSPRQYLAALLSRFMLLPRFHYVWVPGSTQQKYARKLGFREAQIHKGFYSCDLPKFNQVYADFPPVTRLKKKRFLYVGRYYEFKGIQDLWSAFTQFKKESGSEWELWCLGHGDLPPVEAPGIRHFGFVQPAELEKIVGECSVFILPSHFEPWGVVVHEYAASGFPLVLSDTVGARDAFLREKENGFSFEAGHVGALTSVLKKIAGLGEKELILMAEKSHELAQTISPSAWATTVKEMFYEGHRK
jgi:glycosyltransferase involved in cell wall biosynthesis